MKTMVAGLFCLYKLLYVSEYNAVRVVVGDSKKSLE